MHTAPPISETGPYRSLRLATGDLPGLMQHGGFPRMVFNDNRLQSLGIGSKLRTWPWWTMLASRSMPGPCVPCCCILALCKGQRVYSSICLRLKANSSVALYLTKGWCAKLNACGLWPLGATMSGGAMCFPKLVCRLPLLMFVSATKMQHGRLCNQDLTRMFSPHRDVGRSSVGYESNQPLLGWIETFKALPY